MCDGKIQNIGVLNINRQPPEQKGMPTQEKIFTKCMDK